MVSILFLLYAILSIIFFLCTLWIIFSIIRSIFGHAPFIPVMDHALDSIVSQLHLDSSSVLVDVGCGNAKVLVAASKKFPDAKMIGIERDLVPYFFARFNARKLKNISIVRKNIFDCDFSNATHLYTYLFPSVMNGLFAKFDRELKPGTILISCDFPFAEKKPVSIIQIKPQEKNIFAKKLFIYTW